MNEKTSASLSHVETKRDRTIRYAVVGLGHIAQVAVLPAFEHARKNSSLAALVSDDPVKLKELGDRYAIENRYSYQQFDDCLQSGAIDAVYIALPNHLHAEYSVRAAEAGIHVLCEKPMAVTEDECQKMLAAAELSSVRLMIAYRLHFEKTNLEAIEIVRSGVLGESHGIAPGKEHERCLAAGSPRTPASRSGRQNRSRRAIGRAA
jgi:predicted dehydrogenase